MTLSLTMKTFAIQNLRRFSSATLKSFTPLSNRVLVERYAAETTTKGGIMIPEKAQGKVLEAKVLAVGPGIRNEEGKLIPMSINVGDRVLLAEYGGTKVIMDDSEYYVFRETDIMGRWND